LSVPMSISVILRDGSLKKNTGHWMELNKPKDGITWHQTLP
jgi:hypothetical protein